MEEGEKARRGGEAEELTWREWDERRMLETLKRGRKRKKSGRGLATLWRRRKKRGDEETRRN